MEFIGELKKEKNSNIFIGRQPIFDSEINIYAYELLYRNNQKNMADFIDEDTATSQVIKNTFIEIGLEKLIGNNKAFINITQNFLTDFDFELFPKDKIVLEILENIKVDDKTITSIKNLSDKGYILALDDFVYHPELEPFIPYSNIIKIDISLLTKEEIKEHVNLLKKYKVDLLAEKIETQEDFDYLKTLGFKYFQGYFFRKPTIIERKTINPSSIAILEILSVINSPSTSIEKLADIVSKDPVICYKLIKLVNSAYTATTEKLDSIQQAISYIGLNAFRNLATIMSLSKLNHKPGVLMNTALVRAKLCSLISGKANYKEQNTFFTVGILSTIDAMLDIPMETILSELPLNDEIKNGLLEETNAYGKALACAKHLEKGEIYHASFETLNFQDLTSAYIEAIEWADSTSREVEV